MNSEDVSSLRRRFDAGDFFLAYMLPGNGELVFADAGSYTLHPWPGSPADVEIPAESTPREQYLHRMDSLTEALRAGVLTKAVVCRVIAGTFRRFAPAEMLKGYFDLFPCTLRFVFGDAARGWWAGSTPELVLSSESPGSFDTIALAGTRRCGETRHWDVKDLREHFVVADAIERAIRGIDGATYTRHTGSMPYGRIEHLCTRFHVECPPDRAGIRERFIGNIHPTPAICGTPRAKAMERIASFEDAPRGYYAGLMTIRRGEALEAYAMLRCVHFDPTRWAVYTGSGITADSSGDAEFDETKRKAAALVSVLAKY